MADTLQLGVFNNASSATGTFNTAALTFTSVVDLNTGSINLVRDSFKTQAPARKQQFSDSNRRYGGSRISSETHDNGAVAASLLVTGSSADDAVNRWETTLTAIESSSADYFIKWQPESATYPVYYEVRGPATWNAAYRWIEFQTASKPLVFEVSWPVAPLATRQPITFTTSSGTYPATVAIPSASGYSVSVPGSAPALLDLRVNSAAIANWFKVSWTKTPATPLSNSVAPFGVLPLVNSTPAAAASTTLLSGTVSGVTYTAAMTAVADSTALNNGRATVASPASGGTYGVAVDIDPSTLNEDDFSNGEVSLEVWARMKVASNHAATVTLSLEPADGTSFGEARYTSEYGSVGKGLPVPSSGTGAWHYYRLGTVTAYVDKYGGKKWRLVTKVYFSAASTNAFGIDYLAVVPSRQRALLPTGKPFNATSYPAFIPSASATTKVVKSDLSGWTVAGTATATSVYHPDSGLGGQLMEIPPGNVSLFVKSSEEVPDEPVAATMLATADTESQTLTISGIITPRYFLGRGA